VLLASIFIKLLADEDSLVLSPMATEVEVGMLLELLILPYRIVIIFDVTVAAEIQIKENANADADADAYADASPVALAT